MTIESQVGDSATPITTTPKIVALDGYTLAPAGPYAGDSRPGGQETSAAFSDWDAVAQLGDLTVYDRTPEDHVVSRAAGAGIALINKVRFTSEVFEQLPKLRYLGVVATGVDNVDLQAAVEHGVTVTNVTGYSTASVAQHVFALILELANLTSAHNQAVHNGVWSACPDFSFTLGPIQELAGKVLGIIGLGKIGQRVAKIGSAFGMHVITPHRPYSAPPKIPGVVVKAVSLDTLFEQADVVTLHCPLNEQTRHLINAERLAKMRRSAYLINTGRGGLVDETALAEALYRGQIAAAGLDVLSVEPPPVDHPLLTAPRCVITPHIAWASVQVKRRLMRQVVDNIAGFLKGQPINIVAGPNISPGHALDFDPKSGPEGGNRDPGRRSVPTELA